MRGINTYDVMGARHGSGLSHGPATPSFRSLSSHRPIGWQGVQGSERVKRQWRRVAAADRHDLGHRSRFLAGAHQVRSVALELGLPPRSADEALKLLVLWRECKSRRVLPRVEVTMAAVIIYISRRDHLFISTSRIIHAFGLRSRFTALKAMNMMERDMGFMPVQHSAPEIIAHLVNEFSLPTAVAREAAGYVSGPLEGPYMPQGVAGGAVYMAARQRNLTGIGVNQETLARACGVTAVTIRNHYHKIAKANGIDPDAPATLHGRFSAPGHTTFCPQWAALVGEM
jgi:transcription initiation factor TFIIIB Brf1 subunit/transcription initiation factor TFIIB